MEVKNISAVNPLLNLPNRKFALEQAKLILAHFPTLEGYIRYAPSEKNNQNERTTSNVRSSLADYIKALEENILPSNQYNFAADPSTATPSQTIVAIDIDDHSHDTDDFAEKEKAFTDLTKEYSLTPTLTIKTKTGKGLQYWYLIDTDLVNQIGRNKISPVVLLGREYPIEIVTNLKGKKTLLELPGNYSKKKDSHYSIQTNLVPSAITSKLLSALCLENKIKLEDLEEWESTPNNKMYMTNPEDHPDNVNGFIQYLTRVLCNAIQTGNPPAAKSNRNNACVKFTSVGAMYNISSETIAAMIKQYLINSPQVFPDGIGDDTNLEEMAERQRDWAVENGIRGRNDVVDVLAPFEIDEKGYKRATRKQMKDKASEVLKVSQRMRMYNEKYRQAYFECCINVPGGKFIPTVVQSKVINDNLEERRAKEETHSIDIDVTQSLLDISKHEPHWTFVKNAEFNELHQYINDEGKPMTRISTSKEYVHFSLSGYQIETDPRYLKQEYMIHGNMIFLCEEPAIKNFPDPPKSDLLKVEKMWRRWCARMCDPENFEEDYEYVTDYYAHVIQHMDGEPNAMIFVGRPGSGKSVMMGILRSMLPRGYSANIANQKLVQSEFFSLVKLLCIDDMESLNEDLAAILKALLTGSEFLVNRKFKEMVNQIIKMSIVAATNNYDIDFKGLDARRVSAICNWRFVDQDEVRESLRKDIMMLTRTVAKEENYYFRVLRTWFYEREVERKGWFYLSRYQKDRIVKGETSNDIVIILANLIANNGYITVGNRPVKVFEPGKHINRFDMYIAFRYYVSLTKDSEEERMDPSKQTSDMYHGENLTQFLSFCDIEYRREFKQSFADPSIQRNSVINEWNVGRTWTFVCPKLSRIKQLLALATEKSQTKSAVEQVMDRYSLNKPAEQEIGQRQARLLVSLEDEEI